MKNSLDCSAAKEKLVEYARRRKEPDTALRGHLNQCPACSERWEAERNLSSGLLAMRIQASSGRSPEAVRGALLNEFAARRRKPVLVRRWLWSVAAAAVLLFSTLLVRDLTKEPVVSQVSTAASGEPSDPQQDGFIEVPYAPPLAQGELVRVVHTELQPAALASLGVNVDPAWTAELPADLLLGQDGFPRAVRVSSEDSGESGF
jgi:hypothetical protein